MSFIDTLKCFFYAILAAPALLWLEVLIKVMGWLGVKGNDEA